MVFSRSQRDEHVLRSRVVSDCSLRTAVLASDEQQPCACFYCLPMGDRSCDRSVGLTMLREVGTFAFDKAR